MKDKIGDLPSCHPIEAIVRSYKGNPGEGCVMSFVRFLFAADELMIRDGEKVWLKRADKKGEYICPVKVKGRCQGVLRCLPEVKDIVVLDSDILNEIWD